MGGGAKAGGGKIKTYFGSIAGVVCGGPVDELVSLIVDGTTVWPTKKHWANGCVEVPIITLQRKSGKARVEFAVPVDYRKGGKIFVTGCADASFDTATPVALGDHNATAAWYNNAGANVARASVSAGVATVVLQYTEGDLVAYAGGIWSAKSTHWGTPETAPPNATYWDPYSVTRAGAGVNPYPFTVENYGQAYFYWGTTTQTVRSGGILEKNGHPPYRRQAVIELEDFLFGQERQAAPNIEVVVRRKPQQTVITGASANLADNQANPLAAAADLLTDPVFGPGQLATVADSTSWQAQADACAAIASQTHVSPLLDRPAAYRAFLAQLLAYFDGWLRYTTAGAIEAGRFLHNAAPPAFTAATTIDYHDCCEEIEWESAGWAQTANESVVKFKDRARAFKDAARQWTSGYNRQVTGEPRQQIIDRPWITREAQAASYAAEWGKINAQPRIAGTLIVRTEKATSVAPGDLFLLTHDAVSLSVVCRCLEKTLAAPPIGRATIRFESERGVAPVPFQPTAAALNPTGLPPAEKIDSYQIIQPPTAIAGDSELRIAILAARKNSLTRGLKPWLKVDDSSSFYQLGEQRGWAVHGLLTQDYAANLPEATTEPPDDTTETLQLDLDEFTVQADLDRITATQTDDAVNDNALLLFLVDDSDRTVFEICTVIAVRLDAGVYKVKVRRARYATAQTAFATGDHAWLIYRSDFLTYAHEKFAQYSAAATAITLRLQAFTGYEEADLTESDECPDISWSFADPYAPEVTWTSVKYQGVEVADFTQLFLPYALWAVEFKIDDANADLVAATLVARLGNLEQTLWSQTFAPSSTQIRATQFSLGSQGAWRLVLVARDATGRVTESELESGGVPVQLSIAEEGSNQVVPPLISPVQGGRPNVSVTVTLSCATAGASIVYQVVAYGAAPGGSWTSYAAPFAVQLTSAFGGAAKRVYAKATKGGMGDSSVTYHDYWYQPGGSQ